MTDWVTGIWKFDFGSLDFELIDQMNNPRQRHRGKCRRCHS